MSLTPTYVIVSMFRKPMCSPGGFWGFLCGEGRGSLLILGNGPTNLLEVVEVSHTGQVRGDKVALAEETHVLFVKLLGHTLFLVKLKACVKDRTVFHVKKLIIISLQNL